jgi:hypothetical protein
MVPPPPPEESFQFGRCGGLLARGRRPWRLPGRAVAQPVAVAADSPLTVAGAAPVLHRTSLSHRNRHANTGRNAAPSFSVTICYLAVGHDHHVERGALNPDRIFPAARENTGKNPFGAQNHRDTSKIDPYNQVLISSFPMRLAGKKSSLPGMPAGKQQGRQKEGRPRPGTHPTPRHTLRS